MLFKLINPKYRNMMKKIAAFIINFAHEGKEGKMTVLLIDENCALMSIPEEFSLKEIELETIINKLPSQALKCGIFFIPKEGVVNIVTNELDEDIDYLVNYIDNYFSNSPFKDVIQIFKNDLTNLRSNTDVEPDIRKWRSECN